MNILTLMVGLLLLSELFSAYIYMPSPFKPLGEFFLTSDFLKNHVGIPVKGVEIFFVSFVAWILFRNRRDELANFRSDPHFRLMCLMGVMIPGAAMIAVIVGQARGHDLALATTQFRYLVAYPFAVYLGYVVIKQPSDLVPIFKVIVAAVLVKSLQGWYCYFVRLGGSIGRYEYLIEHWTSDYMVTAMTILAATYVFLPRHRLSLWATALLIGIIFVPYVINDRRTSFIGLAASLAFAPLVLTRYVRLWHLGAFGGLAAGLLGFIAATWQMKPPLGFLASAIRTVLFPIESPYAKSVGGIFKYDYRDLENFNLLSGLWESPVLGMGLGTRFPKAIEMADISKMFPFWDSLPHNNLLLMWAFCGPLGIAALGAFAAMATAVAVRLSRATRDPLVVVFSLVLASSILRWLFWVVGDLGLIEVRMITVLGVFVGAGLSLLRRTELAQ